MDEDGKTVHLPQMALSLNSVWCLFWNPNLRALSLPVSIQLEIDSHWKNESRCRTAIHWTLSFEEKYEFQRDIENSEIWAPQKIFIKLVSRFFRRSTQNSLSVMKYRLKDCRVLPYLAISCHRHRLCPESIKVFIVLYFPCACTSTR